MSCIKVCSHAEISQEKTIIKQLLYRSKRRQNQWYIVSTYQKAAKIDSTDLFVKHVGSVLKNVGREKVLG